MRRILLIWAIGLAYYSSWGQIPADTVLANQYYRTADSLSQQGEYERASQLFTKAQRIYQEAEAWERYIACLNGKAWVQWAVTAYDSAYASTQQALQLSEQHLGQDHPEAARTYNILGIIHEYRGEYEQTLTCYQQALNIRMQHYQEDHPEVADSYEYLGIIHEIIGEYDQSLSYYEKALEIRQKVRPTDYSSLADIYSNMGGLYESKGFYDQALAYHQKALAIDRQLLGDTHPNIAINYSNIGILYQSRGAYDQALAYHQKALAIDRQLLGDTHPDVAADYNNIGTVYRGKREYDQALAYYQKAITIKCQLFGDTHPDIAISYANLGVIHEEKKEYDQALAYHQKALAIDQKLLGEMHPYVAIDYNNLGAAYEKKRAYDQAFLYYQRTLNIYLNLFKTPHPYKTLTLNNISRLEQQRQHYSSALSFYQQSLAANGVSFRDTSEYAHPTLDHYLDGSELLRTLKGKAEVLSKLKLDSVAYQTYLLADSLLHQLHRSYAATADKVSLARTARQLYEGAIQSALRQHQITQNRNYLQKAFYFSERSKAGVLTGALSASEARRFGQVPDSLIAQESALKADRSFYQSRLTSADSSMYQAKLFDTNRQYDSLMLVLETQYPDYHQLKYATRLATVADVQSQLSPEEAVVSYFVGDSSRYAFTITQDQYQVTILPNDTLLDQRIQSLRRALHPDSTSHVAFPQLASRLYEQLLAPIVNDSLLVNIKRLTIIPDGAVGYLPFDLLLTHPVTDNADYRDLPYLMRDFTIRYGYSATWLFHPFSRTEQPVQDQYIAFAPSYQGTLDSTQQLALGRFRDQIAPLHFNQQEATNIRQHLSGVSLTNQSAVERRFKEEANQYDIIHLAMHALVDDENPLYSRLVFTPDATDTLEDGYLHAYELYDMELSASLAVLSACETGYGKLEQGEGIMSLARAFAYAGCPSIVMSHWLVDDAASAQLMNYFYKYLSEGLLQDEALRQAKLHYLQSASLQKAHPFFWSNFVLVGEATPLVSINTSSTLWVYVTGSIVLLLGLGVIGYAYRPKQVFSR